MATSKNYGKKKGSDHFRDILNPYGEKSNYGKIGCRRRLSKLNVFFFHNSVGDHIHIWGPSFFQAYVPTWAFQGRHPMYLGMLLTMFGLGILQSRGDGDSGGAGDRKQRLEGWSFGIVLGK